MGSASSSVQITELISNINQSFNTNILNDSDTEQYNKMKSELINNYIQNLTNRNMDKNEYEANMKKNLETVANNSFSNTISHDELEISGNKAEVIFEQVNKQTATCAQKMQELFDSASEIINKAGLDVKDEVTAVADMDLETLNDTCQAAISTAVASAESSGSMESEQESKITQPSAGIGIFPPLIGASSSYQKTHQEQNMNTEVNQSIKNIQRYILSNDQSFVNHLNNSLDRLIENIHENSTKIDQEIKSRVEASNQGSNTIQGGKVVIKNNTAKVSFSQLNEQKADALAEMTINSIFDSSASSDVKAVMADMIDLGSSTSSTMSNTTKQSSEGSASASSSITSAMSAKTKSVIKGSAVVVIVLVVVFIIIMFVKNNKDKEAQQQQQQMMMQMQQMQQMPMQRPVQQPMMQQMPMQRPVQQPMMQQAPMQNRITQAKGAISAIKKFTK